MKNILLILTVLLGILLPKTSFSQIDTTILLQGFNWESKSNPLGWYNVIKDKAVDLNASRIDLVWFPPSSRSADSAGYLPNELYDLDVYYGTKQELKDAILTLNQNNINAVADIVINHRTGNLGWADFYNPTWGCWAVTADDEWGLNGGNPCGNGDTGIPYEPARDIDHTNVTVQNDLEDWLNWMKDSIGFVGWRYDFVRGYSGSFVGMYNTASSPEFSVGENWCDFNINDINACSQSIVDWIDDTGGNSSAFDFALKGVLNQAVNNELWRLNHNGGLPGVLGYWPQKSVTFIDNHDTGSTQNYWPFPGDKVMQGYAYILTHPGVPSIFWDHFYDWGLHDQIKDLVAARKDNELHSNSQVSIQASNADLYAAIIDNKVAMKIGAGSWSPTGPDWQLRASGVDYAVWDMAQTPPPADLCPQPTMTLYLNSTWTNPHLYFWDVVDPGRNATTTWPGEAMTQLPNGWWAYTLEGSASNVIFSDNGAAQTVDLNTTGDSWYNDGWVASMADPLSLDINLFLEGPFDGNTGTMKDDLRVAGYLPLECPYESSDELMCANELAISGNGAIVDWIEVQLRDATNPGQVVATRPAVVMRNGQVVSSDRMTAISFDVFGLNATSFLVSIHHRNHLDVTYTQALTPAPGLPYSLDFTTLEIPGQQLLTDGVHYGLISGSANGDNSVDAVDRSEAWNHRNESGYLLSDVNMDGTVDAADRSVCWNNRNLSN